MCGRFARTSSREVLVEEFGVARCVDVLRPRYNIAPSQLVEAIIGDGVERRLGPMKWGRNRHSHRSRPRRDDRHIEAGPLRPAPRLGGLNTGTATKCNQSATRSRFFFPEVVERQKKRL
jgi:hypothetical protein